MSYRPPPCYAEFSREWDAAYRRADQLDRDRHEPVPEYPYDRRETAFRNMLDRAELLERRIAELERRLLG